MSKKIIRIMMLLVLVFSLVLTVSGCFPSGNRKTTENDAQIKPSKPVENATTSSADAPAEVLNDNVMYTFYNKVKMNQSKAEVDSALGVAPVVDEQGAYVYSDADKTYGVNVNFGENNVVVGKSLAPPSASALLALNQSSVNEGQVSQITEGMTYDQVKGILGGDGFELLQMANPIDVKKPIYGMIWLNADGSFMNVLFIGYKGSVYTAEFTKGE